MDVHTTRSQRLLWTLYVYMYDVTHQSQLGLTLERDGRVIRMVRKCVRL